MLENQKLELTCPHCATEVSVHEATRCLDAWVVEKIMDFDVRIGEDAIGEFLPLILDSRGGYYAGGDGVLEKPVACYSTSISAAWKVVEKLRKERILLPLWSLAMLENFPLAICRAAIKAYQ